LIFNLINVFGARKKKQKFKVKYCRVILRLARHVADTVCVVVSYYQGVIFFLIFLDRDEANLPVTGLK
jgi:hypothetical protein